MKNRGTLIRGGSETEGRVRFGMSMRLGLNRFQEGMVIVLMLVFIFALNSNMEVTYKISIAVLVFIIILLTSFASQILKVGREQKAA